MQCKAGAKASVVCEPAANTVYVSPNQLEADPSIFSRLVIDYNQRVRQTMREHGTELIFHDCGELSPMMLEAFNELEPAMLSVGSPVNLWEVAEKVSLDTVLFGNLPTKKFYSDAEYPVEKLRSEAAEIRERMNGTGHPYILGSECDVLSVRGHEDTIREKVQIMLSC